jgi:hypothetical protein
LKPLTRMVEGYGEAGPGDVVLPGPGIVIPTALPKVRVTIRVRTWLSVKPPWRRLAGVERLAGRRRPATGRPAKIMAVGSPARAAVTS